MLSGISGKNGAIDLDWTGDMFQYDPFAGRIPQ